MIAISSPIRTIYDCNVKIGPEIIVLDESRENKFSIIATIFGPFC